MPEHNNHKDIDLAAILASALDEPVKQLEGLSTELSTEGTKANSMVNLMMKTLVEFGSIALSESSTEKSSTEKPSTEPNTIRFTNNVGEMLTLSHLNADKLDSFHILVQRYPDLLNSVPGIEFFLDQGLLGPGDLRVIVSKSRAHTLTTLLTYPKFNEFRFKCSG